MDKTRFRRTVGRQHSDHTASCGGFSSLGLVAMNPCGSAIPQAILRGWCTFPCTNKFLISVMAVPLTKEGRHRDLPLRNKQSYHLIVL